MITQEQIEVAKSIEELKPYPIPLSRLGETLWKLVEADLLDRETANKIIRAELLRIADSE